LKGVPTPFTRFVDEVRQAADLVSLVSTHVSLRRSGVKLKGLCPFHQEKTPSFYVDEAKQLFYCFGCGKGGDAFKFLMMQEKVEFAEAARLLGERFGIRPPERDSAGAAARDRLCAALTAAQEFYHERLFDRATGAAARAYLKTRGVTGETARRLGLGYAPAGWETLRSALMAQGFAETVLIDAGLLVRRQTGGAYDRFRNRILFPIRNVSGRCLAFGGRALGEEEPKYLNSPETGAYRKGEHLYGLELTGQAVRAQGAAVLVEGYMDFLSVFQAGIANVVATLGTAFTESQAMLLRRYSSSLVLGFDSDRAGITAAGRTLEKLLPLGFAVRFMELPDGHDPDSFLREAGAAALQERLEKARGWFEVVLERELDGKDARSIGDRIAVVESLGPLVLKTPNRLERAAHVALLAQRLGVDEAILWSELRRGARREPGTERASRLERTTPDQSPAEYRLVRLLLEQPAWQQRLVPRLQESDFTDLRLRHIVNLLAEGVKGGQCRGTGDVLQALGDDSARELLARFAVEAAPAACEEEAEACTQALERRRLQHERRRVQVEMESEKDPVRIGALMQRKIRLSKEIDALS
jgi:DNA primase